MPFGPLVTLILLIYLLFLGIVMSVWFVLSPGHKVDEREVEKREVDGRVSREAESERVAYQRPTPAEQRRQSSPGVYARAKNDEVRGANARGISTTNTSAASTDTRGADTRGVDTRGTNTRGTNAPAKSAPAKKNDAFEDFIRSKNDDFEF